MTDPIHATTLALAKELLSRRSLTPDDAGCLDVIAARLRANGFNCERLDRGGVGNLWAHRGEGDPVVCLAGHVDVVPPGPLEAWTDDPFTPTERGGNLYARGATDMKGPLAAAITALERAAARVDPRAGTIGLIVTSDEEGAAVDGTTAVVDALRGRGQDVDACIVAESTSINALGDEMKNGRRGSLEGTLTVRGRQSHIAYPHLGINPVHVLAPALAELTGRQWDAGNDHFPPTSFQVSNIHAGTGAGNVIPGALTLRFNFRFSPVSTVDALKAGVEEILGRHGVDGDIEWRVYATPFLTVRGPLVDTLAAVVQDVTGRTPALSTAGGTSDARFLATLAREVVEFGGVNATMHQVNECMALADFAPLSRIYEETLVAFIARRLATSQP